MNEELKSNEILEKEMNDNQAKENYLEQVEQMLFDEMVFYSDKDKTINAKQQRLNVTDRICKLANGILATENLKERKYMNRTERRAETRRMQTVNKN